MCSAPTTSGATDVDDFVGGGDYGGGFDAVAGIDAVQFCVVIAPAADGADLALIFTSPLAGVCVGGASSIIATLIRATGQPWERWETAPAADASESTVSDVARSRSPSVQVSNSRVAGRSVLLVPGVG